MLGSKKKLKRLIPPKQFREEIPHHIKKLNALHKVEQDTLFALIQANKELNKSLANPSTSKKYMEDVMLLRRASEQAHMKYSAYIVEFMSFYMDMVTEMKKMPEYYEYLKDDMGGEMNE